MRTKLTPGRIAAFICPPGKQQVFLRDSEQTGLGVRATAGAKSYIFQGKLAGNVIRMTIGDPRDWSLDDARKEARRLKTLVDEGRDPRQVKAELTAADAAKRQKDKQGKAPALAAWKAYIQARAPKWGDRHKGSHEEMMREGGATITRGKRPGMSDKKAPGILRDLLMQPLRDITRDRVVAWLDDEGVKRPAAARRALACLGAFLAWAGGRPEYRGEVHADACARLARELPAAKAKTDCLQREQLAAWFDAVRKLPNPAARVYLQVLLLTGARREELARLRWADVDFHWKSLTIRDKVEGERTIGLTPYVAAVLTELKLLNEAPPPVRHLRGGDVEAVKWKPSPWVFASKTAADGRMKEPRIAHNKALVAAGLPPLSIHGLRRSFGTLAEWVECPAGISAQIMGHKPSALAEKHYRRRPLDLLRMWHTKIEDWMLAQAHIEQPREGAFPDRAVIAA